MKRLDLILGALLAALPVLFHWRVLTPNALDRGSFPTGDFAEQFYAFARFAYDELAQGRLPVWNPYTYAGHPFIADVQSALFYPPSLGVMLVSSLTGGFSLYALEWQAVLHFSLAGVFMFWFARRQFMSVSRDTHHVSRWAAFVTAITFTFGGYLTSYPSQQLAILETNVWLPLILLMIAMRWWAGAGVCFGIALLAGHPQSALYVLLVSAAYLIVGAWPRWRAMGKPLAFMLLVALGVSAAQWLPSLELMRLSSRTNLSYADYARGFELHDPLQLLLPGAVSVYSPLYVGIVPLALVIVALWLHTRIKKSVAFWFALALSALALSFGGNLFLYPILYLFAPGFALFRQQERAAFVFSFALAMLAGYGALALASPLSREARARLHSFARLMLGAVIGALLLFVAIYFAWMVALLDPASAFRAAASQVAWLLLMLALACGLWWARLRGALTRKTLLIALALVAALDLFTVNWHTNFQPTPPEAQTRAPALLAPIAQDDSLFRTYNEYRLFGNFGDLYHIEDTWGASPLRLARYEQFAKLPMERLWSLLNVKYVITWRQALNVPSEIVAQEKVSETETTYVHRLRDVSPRAAVVTCVEVLEDDEALGLMGTLEFDFTRCALLAAPIVSRSARVEAGSATLSAHAPQRYEWLARAPSDGLFVLSENFYPGWRAFVDEREVSIARANYTMMAVPLPAGEHRVTFLFDPLSVKVGIGISMLTLLSLLAGWLLARFRASTR